MLQQTAPKEFISLEIKANYTCNSKCDYCCISNNQRKRSMTHNEIAANIDFFKNKYNIEEVCLSGGEPTVHKNFLENLRYVREQGLRVYLHTNGIKFYDAEFADACAPFLNRVLVGFSFHDEQLCKNITGTGNTFAKRLAGIKNLLDRGVTVRTNTVIVRSNYMYLPEISEIIKSLGLHKALFTLPFFFDATVQQVESYVPESFDEVKPYLRQAIDLLTGHSIKVSLQGLPPCKLDEFKDFQEIDPDRAFVDSSHQLDQYDFLFSGMLGYAQTSDCDLCTYTRECWGFPKPGALGKLGETISLPR